MGHDLGYIYGQSGVVVFRHGEVAPAQVVHEVLLQEQDEILLGPADSYTVLMVIYQRGASMRVMLLWF